MKNKGFTLIELLATLIILALITSVVTIVTLNTMKKAKEKERDILVANIIDGATAMALECVNTTPKELPICGNINENNKIPLGDLVKYGYIKGDENGKIYNPAASKEEYKDVTDCEFYIETIKNVAEFHICEMNESGKPICPNGPQIEKCYELKLAVDGGK